MNHAFGIDKVGLWIPSEHYSIKSTKYLTEVNTKRVDAESGEERVSYNAGYNAPDGLFMFDHSDIGARVQFNPSKPYHPYELCGSSADLIERTNRVFDKLDEIGISVNRESSQICRLDITRNIKLDQPLTHYADSLALVKIPRAKRQVQYPGGFLSGNNTRALVVYDKSEESNLEEHGIARGELQLRKREALKPIGWSYSDAELFKRSKDLFTSTMEKTFQINAYELCNDMQLAISFDQFSQLWSNLKVIHPRNTMQQFDNVLSAYAIIDRIGIPQHLNFCRSTGMQKKNVERRRKELLNRAKQLHLAGLTDEQTKGSIAVNLLVEISRKLIAA
jgi:hypothetical protein